MAEWLGTAITDAMSWAMRQLRETPRRLFGRWIQRLPMDFRILYKQFLLRILDMEALSVEADMVEYLAQFAGILIFISGIQGVGVAFVMLLHSGPFTPDELYTMGWTAEHGILEKMVLAAGLVVVFLWDAPFPDRRDVMVLGPLPVRPGTILAAKIVSSAAVLGVAVVCLNWATNFVWPVVLGGGLHSLRLCLACWLAVTAAAIFLFSILLAVEGLGALLLPRQIFLRLSALGQLAAFVLFPTGYILLGQIDSPSAMMAAENHWMVVCWPGYWFLALLKQVAGELPPEMNWLAWLAWSALALSVIFAAGTLIASYHRTLRRIAEQPDLEPSRSGRTWQFPLGGRLQTVLVYFSLRTLGRSRQHRIALAFSWALVLVLALCMARSWMEARGPQPVDESFLTFTMLMMALAVGGMRGVFALPIEHKANWTLRVTQLRPTENYLAATRRVLLLLVVVPVCLLAALFSLGYRPWLTVAGHLLLLTIFGVLAIEVSLIGFTKLPFTCSFLPGKTNMQFIFWGYVIGAALMVVFVTSCEQPALASITSFVGMALTGIAAAIGLRLWNGTRERKAELYFEEKPEPPLITLGLIVNPRARI
jgi:hypothetical protein